MFKLTYDPTKQSLFTPGAADDFFQHGPITTDAALCAEMARLAYVTNSETLRRYLALGGYDLVKAYGFSKPGTQAFIARRNDDNTVVLAFRGTEASDPTDIFTDARFNKAAWAQGGNVHAGFLDALDPAFEQLQGHIPSNARTLYTGHSLGAALATLAASRCPPAALYTFGSPRVGDDEFVKRFPNILHERYDNCCDIVARVPPEAFGYQHTGTFKYIDKNGAVHSQISGSAIDADRTEASFSYVIEHGLTIGNVAVRELADHSPVNYLSGVMGIR